MRSPNFSPLHNIRPTSLRPCPASWVHYTPIYQNSAEKGLAGDLVEASFQSSGIDAEFKFLPAFRVVRAVADGEVNCGIGGSVLFQLAPIIGKVNISSVVQYVSQVFFYNVAKYPNGIGFHSLEDMKKYRIGVLRSSGIQAFLEKGGLDLIANSFHEGSARQLQTGRIDVWATVDLTGLLFISSLFPSESASYQHTKPFNRGDVSVVFSKVADPDGHFQTRFQQGLAAIKRNGTYLKIMSRYYGGIDKIDRQALSEDMR